MSEGVCHLMTRMFLGKFSKVRWFFHCSICKSKQKENSIGHRLSRVLTVKYLLLREVGCISTVSGWHLLAGKVFSEVPCALEADWMVGF